MNSLGPPPARNASTAPRRKYYFIAAVVMVFLVPVAFIALSPFAKHNIKALPIYGPRLGTDANGDTVYATLPEFSLIDANGKPFTRADLEGRIHVADFFFTTCPGICPRLSSAMMELQDEIADYEGVFLVSYTIDPRHDRPDTLQAYAERYQANPQKWRFVTSHDSTTAPIYNLAKTGYLQLVSDEGGAASENGYLHSNRLVLVDPDLRVRGVYRAFSDATGPTELKRLKDEIKVLMNGEYRGKVKPMP